MHKVTKYARLFHTWTYYNFKATKLLLLLFIYLLEVKSKSKGLFQKKHIHCKYTETKLILLFNARTTH